MKKKLPIGISDFQEIIEDGYYYVDKSLLIKEIDESGKVVLMTRPRRFGKTLNLSMLHYFFEKSEKPTNHLFENLEIWKHDEYRKMQGKYPVIFITFKNIVQPKYSSMIKKFATTIAREFEEHAYLLESTTLSDHEKKEFDKFRSKSASEDELGDSLAFLTNMLYKHFNQKVVLLIDEYDVPVQAAFVYGFYDEIILFMKELLTGALKDQKYLHKGVVTGIMTLAKAGILTGLNNLDIYNLTNPLLADKFGFTSEEAKELLTYYDIADLEVIKKWYNGYLFGETNNMYNPWSILNCIRNQGSRKIYWANTNDNILLKRLIARSSSTTKSELEQLLKGKTIEKTIDESIVYPEVDQDHELIWSVLLFTGYLTYTHYTINGQIKCNLIIPNEEIYILYSKLIQKIFTDSITGGNAHHLLKALTEGNTKAFELLLKSFVLNSMSVYDISSSEPESSYHLFVLGLLVMLSEHYEVTSNRESGLGRYDILITPKEKSKPAIVIEFKKVWNDTIIEKAAQKALDQIIDKKYAQGLYDQGYDNIIAYGIAFKGKDVAVVSCTLEKPQIEC